MPRCLITGQGGRGRHWTKALQARDDIELLAAVEPAEPMRKLSQEQFGFADDFFHDSLEAALKAVEVDFIVDVTPPSVHAQVARQAFSQGLHLLGEKPLSDDYATAASLVKEGREAGVVHMITQNYRFSPGARKMGELVGGGKVGRVGQCDVRFYMNWADAPGSHYVTQPYMLINDMMVHHFDLMRFILKSDPISVQAITWNPHWGWHAGDAAHSIVFEFEQGLRATHVAVGCAVGSRTDYNGDWRVEGDAGSLDWSKGRIDYAHLHRVEEQVNESIALEQGMPSLEDAMLDEFLSAIAEQREPECSAADNLKSVTMVFAAIESAKRKQPMELEQLAKG